MRGRPPPAPQPRTLRDSGEGKLTSVGQVLKRIPLQDWPFDDGAPPPGKVVEDWLSLLKAKFYNDPGSCVAVHCVAGLGR